MKLLDGLPVLGRLAVTSVAIGSIYVLGRSIEVALGRFVKQLMIPTESDDYPYQFRGSMTPLNIDGHYVGVCCCHQFTGIEPQNIMINVSEELQTISSNGVHRLRAQDTTIGTDIEDIACFNFPVAEYNLPTLERHFFPVSAPRIWPSEATGHFILFGYPFNKVDYQFEEKKINVGIIYAICVLDGVSSSPGVLRLRTLSGQKIYADGLSGGPVYYLGQNKVGFFVGFAGMIIRGGQPFRILTHIRRRNYY